MAKADAKSNANANAKATGNGNGNGNNKGNGNGNGNGNGHGNGNGNGKSTGATSANTGRPPSATQSIAPVVQGQNGGPQSNPGVRPSSASTDGPGPPIATPHASDPTPVAGAPHGTTTSGTFTGDGISSTDWSRLGGSSYGGGTVGNNGASGIGNNDNADGSSDSTSMPKLIGGLVAVMVLLLVLVALLLYKYRYRRHVQDLLKRILIAFRIPHYTRSEKRRSSTGTSLLSTEGNHERTSSHEKWAMDLPAPVTHPDPAIPRPESSINAPLPIPSSEHERASRTLSVLGLSPMGLPQTPAPTVPRRSSHESLESISIISSDISSSFLPRARSEKSRRESLISLASSGVFSSSMLSWAAPPSVAPGVATPSPARISDQTSLSELAARYKPLTPTKPTTPTQEMSSMTATQHESLPG